MEIRIILTSGEKVVDIYCNATDEEVELLKESVRLVELEVLQLTDIVGTVHTFRKDYLNACHIQIIRS